MINESKNPTAKEAVKDQIAIIIRHIEHRIADMTEKMNSNFVRFFEWHAEEMYKTKRRQAFYADFCREVESIGPEIDLSVWILAIASHKSEELVRGKLSRNSTSQIANYAYLLNLEAEQELIKELEGLAHIAEHYARC